MADEGVGKGTSMVDKVVVEVASTVAVAVAEAPFTVDECRRGHVHDRRGPCHGHVHGGRGCGRGRIDRGRGLGCGRYLVHGRRVRDREHVHGRRGHDPTDEAVAKLIVGGARDGGGWPQARLIAVALTGVTAGRAGGSTPLRARGGRMPDRAGEGEAGRPMKRRPPAAGGAAPPPGRPSQGGGRPDEAGRR